MPRPSKVDRLPAEIREAIAGLRRNGRTIDEILKHLRGLGVDDIARSSLGEHVQRLDRIAADAMRDRAMADALVARFGEEPDDKLARANIELMHGMLFKLNLAAREEEGATLDPKDLKFLTEALRNLANAAKTDADRFASIEKRAREKALREASEVVDQVAATGVMSAQTKADLKAAFLGIR